MDYMRDAMTCRHCTGKEWDEDTHGNKTEFHIDINWVDEEGGSITDPPCICACHIIQQG